MVDGHLGYFHLPSIVYKAAMNMNEQVSPV